MDKASLIAWRKAQGMTQEQAADWIGLSWRQYQRLEAGHSKVKAPIAKLIQSA